MNRKERERRETNREDARRLIVLNELRRMPLQKRHFVKIKEVPRRTPLKQGMESEKMAATKLSNNQILSRIVISWETR